MHYRFIEVYLSCPNVSSVGFFTDPALVSKLIGEIGVAPFGKLWLQVASSFHEPKSDKSFLFYILSGNLERTCRLGSQSLQFKSTRSFRLKSVLCNVLVGGDYSNDSVCNEYWNYWKEAGYPGLPSSGIAQSRSYTPYLLDTVKLYFEACDALSRASQPITALNVWNILKAGTLQFRGCTGWVAIDPLTGSRSVAVQPPVYDLVAFAQLDWEVCC